MSWIDEIIQGTIELYGTSDPFELCDFMGIVLQSTNRDSAILKEQHSMYIRNFCSRECIFYAEGMRYKRLKFYILHELGHALLHPYVMCSRHTNNLKLERQANYFAFRMILRDCGEEETIERFALVNDIPRDIFNDVI